jgi:excisionase family DNA binding protein
MMEQTYSIKEVANLLKVNEETVRRWVRRSELQGELDRGKKGGFKIKTSYLEDFLIKHPKYRQNGITKGPYRTIDLTVLDESIRRLDKIISDLSCERDELIRIRELLIKETL